MLGAEEGESTGAFLKRVREERGVTVENAADDLNLKKEYIEAIDSDTILNHLPAAYARGFLRNYAEYLELDYHEIVERFKSRHVPETPRVYYKEMVPIVQADHRGHARSGILSYITLAILVVALVAAVYFAQKYISGSRGSSGIADKEERTPAKGPSGKAGDGPGAREEIEYKYHLEVKCVKNATIKWWRDGAFAGETAYAAGEEDKFRANGSLRLEINTASNVQVYRVAGGKKQELDDKKLLEARTVQVILDDEHPDTPDIRILVPPPDD